MGNDRKPTSDVAKAPPGAASAVLAASLRQVADEASTLAEGPAVAASGVSERRTSDPGAPVDYCARVHVLRFETLDGTNPQLHQRIRLRIANPPYVIDAQGELIGVLCDPQDSAIRWCLVEGYVMTGEIVALAADRQYGEIEVSGRMGEEIP